MYQRKWLLEYLMHCNYKCVISILFTYLSFQFSVVIFNRLLTISGTKYPSHRSTSCTGITGILERYETWQVVAYITLEHATQCAYYFFLVRLFHKNVINAGCRKLYDTSRQLYMMPIPVWHHNGHVWYYIFIGVLYKINIHVFGQNDVLLVIKFGYMVSNDNNPLYINSIKAFKFTFWTITWFVNIKSSLRTTFNSESYV